ncbi:MULTISPECIES: cysteine dioxygenase [Streptomyces]|uniref:cysteine dioxygenase n=1 Tax=Streptomyces TaxID=1883 RepID=UPI001F20227B|nr:cysteine dioxygenase family protein [Streptomyces sp. SID2888]
MNSDSDLQIAGDILEVPHLLQPPREHPATVAEFAGLARTVAADRSQWEHLVRYDAASRWYHRLRTGPGYEVWLLSWVPGQGSGLHDHGRSSGVLTVLDGALTERTERGTRALRAGAQRVFAPGYVHEVVNDTLEPAVSLHIYFPGLTEMPMHHKACAAARGTTAAATGTASALNTAGTTGTAGTAK